MLFFLFADPRQRGGPYAHCTMPESNVKGRPPAKRLLQKRILQQAFRDMRFFREPEGSHCQDWFFSFR